MDPVPKLHHYINGERIVSESNHYGAVYDPASGKRRAQTPFATSAEVDRAVAAGRAAFARWSGTPPMQRARVLFRFRDKLEQHRAELAAIVSAEHGKTLEDASGSVQRGLEVVEFACGIPQLLKGEISEQVANGIDSFCVRQALGVCVGITPFNFPAMVPMWMFPIAIACGNTFILKPSEKDPSCAVRLAELASLSGLPAGVLNVINGSKRVVDQLLHHRDVAAVSFVGSTAVAEYIHHTGSANGKRVQALGGAKNHLVVMPDADMKQVTEALIGSAYGSAGERCMAVSVAVAVGEQTADTLVQNLLPRVKAIKVGAYDQPEAEMGPLITAEHRDKVLNYIADGVAEGAELVLDGRDCKVAGNEDGFFLGGCLFDRVQPQMRIYREEIFGPVLSVVRVNDYEQALALVNEHEYGNGAAIFTRDGDAARDFQTRAAIGMIGVNVPIPVPSAYYSFGGWKRSLFGDHFMHGPEGVRFFTRLKTITARWPSGIREGAQFNFKSGAEA